MSKASNTFSWLRSILVFVPLIYLYTAVMGALSLLSSFFDREGGIQHWFARQWSRMILKTIGTPVVVSGMDKIDPARPAVYAVNHASALDIPVVFAHLPNFRILAKRELFRYPFLGWHLKRSGQIPIERESAAAGMSSVKKAVHTLRHGMALLVFPEGGRSRDGHIQPFLSGAFYAAIRAGVDVVPVALVGAFEALPMDTYHIRPRPIRMMVGSPIATAGYSVREMDKLAARTREVICELYYAEWPAARGEENSTGNIPQQQSFPS